MEYVRNMHYTVDVDYDFIRVNLYSILKTFNLKNDGIFDWHNPKVISSSYLKPLKNVYMIKHSNSFSIKKS